MKECEKSKKSKKGRSTGKELIPYLTQKSTDDAYRKDKKLFI